MQEHELVIACVMEESWLTLEQAADACRVEPDWLLRHLDEGLLPAAESLNGTWRLSSASLLRARRMRELERNFDAIPELAALVADMLEEMDSLRQQLRSRRTS